MAIRFDARNNTITTDANSIGFDQPITTPASTTTLAGLNIAEAVAAPSAPVDGDVWVTAAGEFNVRLNGSTVDLSAGGGGDVSVSGTPLNGQIAVWTDGTTIEGDATLTWDNATDILSLNSKDAIDATDTFLRLNNTNAFTSGVFVNSHMRLDDDTGIQLRDSAGTLITNLFVSVATSDFNITTSNATDINITGFTSIQAGAVDADFDNLTATNFTGSSSGTNTGDQTITLTGDVTGSGTGSFAATIANSAVTNTKMADMAANTVKVRTVSTGAPQDLSISANTVLGAQGAGLVSAQVATGQIANDAVTYAKMQNVVADDVFLGNNAGAGGIVDELTGTEATALLDTFATGATTQGVVPGSNSLGATYYLDGSGSWSIPAGGSGNVSNTGTPVNNQLAIWTDATTIEGDAKVTFDGSSFAAYGDGTAPDNHYLGLDSTNRWRLESGANYGVLHYEDDNVSTETRNMYFNIQSLASGVATFWWRVQGSDVVQWDCTNGKFIFAGGLEVTSETDHVGTMSANRGQMWMKDGSLGGALMFTEGDSNNDFHTLNVSESIFTFDTSTTAADPGAGDIRFDNATPASVTNLYIDDVEDSGRDASYLLANLSIGDLIKIRSMWDAADYLVARVDGTPTDNTGYWTVPVAVVFAGSLPALGDFLHIDVEWVGTSSSAAESPSTPITYSVYKASDETVNNSTTLQNDDDLVLSNVATGLYRLDMVVKFRDVAVSGCGAKLDFTTTGVDGSHAIMWVTNKNFSGAATRSYEEQGLMSDDFDAIGLATGSSTSRMAITAYFRATTGTNSLQFRWAQNTAQANDLEVESGSWMAITRLGPPT